MKKEKRNFFYRINPNEVLAELVFVEDREQWLVQFLDDLRNDDPERCRSEISQRMVVEAHNFREKRSKAGKASAEQRSLSVEQQSTYVEHMCNNAQPVAVAVTEAVTVTEEDLKRVGIASDKPKRPRVPKMTDDEWMQSLKENEAYKGLNIEVLKAKMEAWCDLKGKKPTRARFLNWLNREDKPMASTRRRTDWDALIKESKERNCES